MIVSRAEKDREPHARSGSGAAVVWAALALALALLHAVPLAAVVLPLQSEGNTENRLPFSCANLFVPSTRYQQVYLGTAVGTGTVSELRFRQDGPAGNTFAPKTFSNVQIYLSTSSKGPNQLSSSFATNRGPDQTLVYSGNLTLSSSSNSSPAAFDITIPLQTAFNFDPGSSKHLLLEVVIPGCKSTSNFDTHNSSGDATSRVTALSASADSGTPDTSGLVTEIVLGAASGYSWQAGGWGQCSAECGGGTRSQTVDCVDNVTGQIVADSFCNPSTRPPDEQSCNTQSCYVWQQGGWGQCSAECGGGTQTQVVECVDSSNGAVVDDSFCNAGSRPPDTQSCNEQSCGDYYWEIGEWGECSVVCGIGQQSREVVCIRASNGNPTQDHRCPQPKPAGSQSCNAGPCGDDLLEDGFESGDTSSWSESEP